MNKKILQKLRGTTDYYPPEMRARKALNHVFDNVYQSFGYEYYDAPILESFELYASKSGDEIVEKQSYLFEDRGGRKVVLRPEMTPSLARMVAEKQGGLPFPIRWYTVANCWRYERPQKGRMRNFFQLNVDLIGSDTAEADAEILVSTVLLMDELNIPREKYRVRISDRALVANILTEAGVGASLHSGVLSIMDRVKKMERSKWVDSLAELGLDETQVGRVEEFMSSGLDENDPRYERLVSILRIAKQQGCEDVVVFDPSIARGLAYYTGMVFEVLDESGVYGRSLAGGGRYDGLLEAVGGKEMSAVGFGAGLVGLETYLSELGIQRFSKEVDAIVLAPFSQEEVSFAHKVAKTLRSCGQSVDMMLPPYGTKKAFKRAQRTGSTTLILVMPDEAKQSSVVVKNLAKEETKIVALGDLTQEFGE